MLIQMKNLSFGYAGHEILKDVSWGVGKGEKVGLVGPNGCGKSTMLHLLRGSIRPDRGEVSCLRGTRVGYLAQSEPMEEERTLADTLLAPFEKVLRMKVEMIRLERVLEDEPGKKEILEQYGACGVEYERLGGYTLEKRIETLLADLGFEKRDLNRSLSSFSGGEVGRVALLEVLVREPDVLLLDEPTNHLDIEAVERLEGFLSGWDGAILVVSHDRTFLNRVCTGIVEIVGGQIEEFKGNFDDYKKQRVQRMELLEKKIAKQKKEIDRLERYIAKNQVGQRARQASSKKKTIERMEKIEIPEDPWVKADQFKLSFEVGDRPGGKQVLDVANLRIGYESDRTLVDGFSVTVYRGERIGIVGPNGCGKSTLLRTLTGRSNPERGTVEIGKDVEFGFFDQNRTDLNEGDRLVDEVKKRRGELSEGAARSVLGGLRFSGDDAFRPVSSLSGGEKNRLGLGLLAMKPWNALALDEPTNHLDIPARQALENALSLYKGTLFVVSHDRYFLDQLVGKIFFLKGDGTVAIELGSYTEARKKILRDVEGDLEQSVSVEEVERKKQKDLRIASRENRKKKQRELERKTRKLQHLEESVDMIEKELVSLEEEMAVSSSGWTELALLSKNKVEKEAHLEKTIEEWEITAKEVTALEQDLDDEQDARLD